jgi:hypothetical protein
MQSFLDLFQVRNLLRFALFCLALIPLSIMSQNKFPPMLHGVYVPKDHDGATYTFHNDGAFEMYAPASCLEGEGKGKGEYVLTDSTLTLQFKKGKQGKKRLRGEETYTITILEQAYAEVIRYRVEVDPPRNAEQVWERTEEILPMRKR